MIAANIKQTLLKSLFISPKMEMYNKEYSQLKDRIFPCEDLFIDFLGENEYVKIVDYSTQILQRLYFESNIAPPITFLENLLKTENQTDHKRLFKEYIGRDHFVHLVNLYMLGIYMFFNVPIFSKLIMEEFNHNIYKNNICDSIKSFIRSWKYFVLYHDVAYPIEMYLYSGCNHDLEKYLLPFLNVNKYIKSDLSLKVLSKTLVLYSILYSSNSRNIRLERLLHLSNNDYFIQNNLKSKVLSEKNINELRNKIGKYQHVNKVLGFESLKYLLTLYNKEDIVGALICNKTGRLCCINYYSKDEDKRINLIPNTFKPSPTLNNILCNQNCLFDDNIFKVKDKVWSYYVPDTKKKMIDIVGIFIDKREKDKDKEEMENFFIGFFDNISSKSKISTIVSDKQFSDYCFNYYVELRETCKPMFNDGMIINSTKYDYILQSQYYKTVKEHPEIIWKSIMGKVSLENSGNEGYCSIEMLIDDILSQVVDKKGEVLESVTEEITDQLSYKVEEKKFLLNILTSIFDNLQFTDTNEFYNSRCEEECPFVDSQYLNQILDMMSEDIKDLVNKQLPNSITIHELINRYVTDIELKSKTKEDEKVNVQNDHGILGALLQYYCYKQFNIIKFNALNTNSYISEDFNNRILWDYMSSKEQIFNNYNESVQKIFYSILIHNIYSKPFEDKFKTSFKTYITSNPFAYFSIFADSIQPWDRRRITNPDFDKIPYNIYTNSFNIKIENNLLYITLVSKDIDIKKEFNNFKSNLDDYLGNVSDFIKLKLAEYN